MISEETIKTEATKLREELKRGRHRNEQRDSGTTEDNGRHDQGIDGEARSGVPVLQRTGSTDGSGTGKIRGNGRSVIRGDGGLQGVTQQPRSGRRRPYEQHLSFIPSSTVDAAEGTGRSVVKVGNFERQDDIPRRIVTDTPEPQPDYTPREKKGPGRPRKVTLEPITEIKDTGWRKIVDGKEVIAEPPKPQSPISTIKSYIPSPKLKAALTEAEVKGFGPILKGALKDYGRYADQYLNHRLPTAGTIWGNLDTDELDALVSSLLSIGKRNGTVAEGVRLVAHSNDYVTTVMILIPRLMQTTQVLQQAPKRPKATSEERGARFRNRFRSQMGEKI